MTGFFEPKHLDEVSNRIPPTSHKVVSPPDVWDFMPFDLADANAGMGYWDDTNPPQPYHPLLNKWIDET